MLPEVYLICHEFSPSLGSECKSGWNIALELNTMCKLTVVAASTNQWGTENYREQVILDPRAKDMNIIWVDQPKIFPRPHTFGSNPLTQILYFQRLKNWSRSVCKMLKDHDIQILHYYNHISYRAYYGGFSNLSDNVYIGPISGFHNIPFGFLKFGLRQNIRISTRNIMNTINKLVAREKFRHKSIRHIFCVSNEDLQALSDIPKNMSVLCDMATDTLVESGVTSKFVKLKKDQLNLLWVGRLDNLKCLDILIKVFSNSARIRDCCQLNVVGDGPNREKYEQIVKTLKCDINFCGKLTPKQVSAYMRNSDLLVHTSIKEASGAVIFEALEAKLPVLCHRAFGYTDLLEEEFSMQVDYQSFDQSVNGFTTALLNVIEDDAKLSSLKTNLMASNRNNTWNDHAKVILNCYER